MSENDRTVQNNKVDLEYTLLDRKSGGLWISEKDDKSKVLSIEIDFKKLIKTCKKLLKADKLKFVALKRKKFEDELPNNNRPDYEVFLSRDSVETLEFVLEDSYYKRNNKKEEKTVSARREVDI